MARAMNIRGLWTLLIALLIASQASAQVLQGKWVDDAEKKIREHRMVNIRLLVLQADDKLAANAAVKIELKRHLFDVGVTWPQEGEPVDEAQSGRAVYRVLNATSLDPLTAWATTHPTRHGDEARQNRVDDAIAWARTRGWTVRWGPLLHADPGRLPGWVSGANKQAVPAIIEEHITDALRSYAGNGVQFDLYAGGANHQYFEEHYGPAFLRKLKELATTVAPDTSLSMRYDDALLGRGMAEMRQLMVARDEQLLPVDALAVDGNVRGFLAPNAINDVMKWFSQSSRPVVLSKVEVGGASSSAAAVNLETLVRLAFAEPAVTGIYFAGLQPRDLTDPTAALLDDDDQPTTAGRVLDELFRNHWRTETDVTTDALGNVRQRVFAGWYRITATLADGDTATLEVLIKPGDAEERIIVLQPLRK
jgi:hypothetical protein